MYQLDDTELAIVAQRLGHAQRGNDSLYTDLLDHICCSIEEQMTAGAGFETAWLHAYQSVCPEGLTDIEDELFFLLHFNKQLNMKRILFTAGFLATFMISTGLLFRILHWPGQNIIMFTGFTFLLMTVIALLFYSLRTMKQLSTGYRFRMIAGIISGVLIATGSMFKILYLPGANIMTFAGMVLLNLVFLPAFFYQLYRKSVAAI